MPWAQGRTFRARAHGPLGLRGEHAGRAHRGGPPRARRPPRARCRPRPPRARCRAYQRRRSRAIGELARLGLLAVSRCSSSDHGVEQHERSTGGGAAHQRGSRERVSVGREQTPALTSERQHHPTRKLRTAAPEKSRGNPWGGRPGATYKGSSASAVAKRSGVIVDGAGPFSGDG